MTLSPSLVVAPALFTVMLALGLGLRPQALLQWRHRPALPLRVLLGSCVLVPLQALLLLHLTRGWPIPPAARFAIALMGLCPSAPLALRKAGTTGGDRQLAALLQVSAALIAILSVPLLAMLFRSAFALKGWEIRPVDVALQVGQVQVLPLVVGLLLRQRLPQLAERLERPLNQVANLLLLLVLLVVLLKAGPLLLTTLPRHPAGLLVMLLLIGASQLLGRLLGGWRGRQGVSTALVTAMRNPGLALLFATRHGAHLEGLKLWILAYVLVTVLAGIPLALQSRQLRQPASP
ncbi:MAG: bile acid:sodium symporter [Synechococcaceae cyanobacterium]